MRVLKLVVMFAATAGCADNILQTTDGPSESHAMTKTEIVLEYGEEKVLDGTALRVNFGDVLEDSRCPKDVTCVWAGNAKVLVGIAAGSGPTHALELNTTLEPHARDRLGVRVTLLSVTPEPLSGQSVPVDAYSVRLRIEPIP
jgi:hypothetical protein